MPEGLPWSARCRLAQQPLPCSPGLHAGPAPSMPVIVQHTLMTASMPTHDCKGQCKP